MPVTMVKSPKYFQEITYTKTFITNYNVTLFARKVHFIILF